MSFRTRLADQLEQAANAIRPKKLLWICSIRPHDHRWEQVNATTKDIKEAIDPDRPSYICPDCKQAKRTMVGILQPRIMVGTLQGYFRVIRSV